MSLKIHPNSHLDHGLSGQQVEFVLQAFKDKTGFFIATITLPDSLGKVACGIHGPSMGDLPVPESEVFYSKRGNRIGKSRMCKRLPRLAATMLTL